MGHARDKQNVITSVYIDYADGLSGTNFRPAKKGGLSDQVQHPR